jgi:hypothetical protein
VHCPAERGLFEFTPSPYRSPRHEKAAFARLSPHPKIPFPVAGAATAQYPWQLENLGRFWKQQRTFQARAHPQFESISVSRQGQIGVSAGIFRSPIRHLRSLRLILASGLCIQKFRSRHWGLQPPTPFRNSGILRFFGSQNGADFEMARRGSVTPRGDEARRGLVKQRRGRPRIGSVANASWGATY